MEDTIVAISTSVGEGAISIIRLSGHDALNIASKVFTKDLTKVDSHTIHYGFITSNNEKIDEVLVSVMKAPKTFTREDIVEINCHGGIATTNKVLEVLLENGARLAEPGEFTKRAFLNGRIDLLEAEATMDLISSKAESARKISINTLTGETSNLIKNLRSELVKIIDTSDLLIYILNNNEEITEEEKEILEKTKNKKRIIVVNKIDLKTKLNKKLLDSYIEISVKENIGIDKIKDEIKRLFNIGEISTNDMTYLSNARSIALLKKSLNNINDAINEINNNNPIDIVELSLKESWNNLGEVIGETYTDELLDELFSRFCLGK